MEAPSLVFIDSFSCLLNDFISDNINCPPLNLTPCQSISFCPCRMRMQQLFWHIIFFIFPIYLHFLISLKEKNVKARGNQSSLSTLCHRVERKMLHVACKLIYFALFTPFISVIASRRSNFTSIFMGTVICHPSTDFAAQCSACLPKTFSKRGKQL